MIRFERIAPGFFPSTSCVPTCVIMTDTFPLESVVAPFTVAPATGLPVCAQWRLSGNWVLRLANQWSFKKELVLKHRKQMRFHDLVWLLVGNPQLEWTRNWRVYPKIGWMSVSTDGSDEEIIKCGRKCTVTITDMGLISYHLSQREMRNIPIESEMR